MDIEKVLEVIEDGKRLQELSIVTNRLNMKLKDRNTMLPKHQSPYFCGSCDCLSLNSKCLTYPDIILIRNYCIVFDCELEIDEDYKEYKRCIECKEKHAL